MKLVVVDGQGQSLGEVRLSRELLRRPNMLIEHLSRVIEDGIRARSEDPSDDRIVENPGQGQLEALDEGVSIMDVPLRLSEACSFDFDKHMDAITGDEDAAREHHKRYGMLNVAQENQRRFDARYKERPGNRIRFK